MGLMSGFIQGAAAEGVKVFGSAMLKELEMQKAKQIAAYTSELRVGEDIAKEGRATAAAAAEREREDATAAGFAEKRTGLMAGSAGLDDANYRGDEGVGVSVQKGQAVPSNRDYLGAQRKFSELARLDETDQTQARQDKRDTVADAKDARDFALREKQERRLAAAASTSQKMEQIKLGQVQELENWRKKMSDKSLPASDRAEAKEMYQALSGKDADQWEVLKTKDAMGMEVVMGRHNKKTGGFEKFDGTGFVPQAGATGGAKSVAVGDVMDGYRFKGGDPKVKSNWEKAAAAGPAPTPTPETTTDKPVSLERAGSTSVLGSKQFIATYADGRRKVVSGDDVERQFILQQK